MFWNAQMKYAAAPVAVAVAAAVIFQRKNFQLTKATKLKLLLDLLDNTTYKVPILL